MLVGYCIKVSLHHWTVIADRKNNQVNSLSHRHEPVMVSGGDLLEAADNLLVALCGRAADLR